MRYRYVEDDEVATRENYKVGQPYNFLDGDKQSEAFYDFGKTTLISDKARVIKGGSWQDRAFWLAPGTRRFREEDKSYRDLGFRCAMTRTGGPTGNDDSGKKPTVKADSPSSWMSHAAWKKYTPTPSPNSKNT